MIRLANEICKKIFLATQIKSPFQGVWGSDNHERKVNSIGFGVQPIIKKYIQF